MRTHATTTEIVKHVLKEHMSTPAPIHIATSKGIYAPEKLGTAPTPSEHSISDVSSLFLMLRWWKAGVKFADLRSNQTEKDGSGGLEIPGLPILFLHLPDSEKTIPILASRSCQLWFDMEALEFHNRVGKVFTRGTSEKRLYFLGADRIIQRFLEALDFDVTCLVAPRFENNVQTHEIFFIGPHHSGKQTDLRAIATGAGWAQYANSNSLDYSRYYLGFTQFDMKMIRGHIESRFKGLD